MNTPSPQDSVDEPNIENVLFDIEDYIGGNVEGQESVDHMGLTVFLRRTITAHTDTAIRNVLVELKEEMKQHTVPEGSDLITRSYLNNTIDFKIAELGVER